MNSPHRPKPKKDLTFINTPFPPEEFKYSTQWIKYAQDISRHAGVEIGDEVFRLRYVRSRLENYANTKKEWERKGKPALFGLFGSSFDRWVYEEPMIALRRKTVYQFRDQFRHWLKNVTYNINKWDRRLKIEKYEKEGISDGIWGSRFGVWVSKLFPKLCGMKMNQPPPYYSVWSEKDQRCFENYEFGSNYNKFRRELFWGLVGFFGMIGIDAYYRTSGIKLWPLRRVPIFALFAGSFFACYFPGTILTLTRRPLTEGMHQLMHTQGCFVAAKARLIADETLLASEGHNLSYFHFLQRDKWDELVWSLEEDDIAFDNFPKKWDWARKENNKLDKEHKEKMYSWYGRFIQMRGKGFQYDYHLLGKGKIAPGYDYVPNYQ